MIILESVSKHYEVGGELLPALYDISLTINKGEFWAITGPSGSGKSTLLNILGLLDRFDSGKFFYQGEDLATYSARKLAEVRGRRFGFIFQSFHLIPRLTSLENVALPLAQQGVEQQERLARAFRQLDAVGLKDRAHHKPDQLSGGQKQRVAIARALVSNPDVIFADEPTGNLDRKTGEDIFQCLIQLNLELEKTVVMVTHDLAFSDSIEHQIKVQDGKIISARQAGT